MRRRCASLRVIRKRPASPGVLPAGVSVRRSQRLGNLGARAETGIDEALRLQLLESFGISIGAVRLDDCPIVVMDAEPFKVLENAVDELETAAAGVEILDPEQEFSAAISCDGMAQRRRIGMSQVEPSGRRGGKTCDLQDSLHGKGDSGDS